MNPATPTITTHSLTFQIGSYALDALIWLGRSIGLLAPEEKSAYFKLLPTALMPLVTRYLDAASFIAFSKTDKSHRGFGIASLTSQACLRLGFFRSTTIENPLIQVEDMVSQWEVRNQFRSCCYVASKDLIVTGDCAEYRALTQPLKVWGVNGGNLQSQAGSFFYKPIETICLNHTNEQLAVVSREYVQVWKLHGKGLQSLPLLQFRTGTFHQAVSALYYEKNKLLYGTKTGQLMLHEEVEGVLPRAAREIYTRQEPVWIDVDHEKNRVYTALKDRIVLIHDVQTGAQLQEIPDCESLPGCRPILDSARNRLITAHPTAAIVHIRDAETGDIKSCCDLTHLKLALLSVHYDSTSELLFIGSEARLIVWNVAKQEICLNTPISRPLYGMQYDAPSGILLLFGCGIQLWDIQAQRLLYDPKSVKMDVSECHWSPKTCRIILRGLVGDRGIIRVLDYAFNGTK